MSVRQSGRTLHDVQVNPKVKLATLWVSVMFLFIYVDHFSLFLPGVIQNAINGIVATFQVTQTWLLAALALMAVPSLMIFLSVALPARVSRWANIVAGIVYIVVVIANTVGETWAFYIVGSLVEVVLLGLVVWYAWRWPEQAH